MEELDGFIAAWSQTCEDLEVLLTSLDPAEWSLPTDCPGWSVQDVIAHLLSIELALVDGTQPSDVVSLDGRSVSSWWTEAAVAQYRGQGSDEILAAWQAAISRRRRQLAADPPTDPEADPPHTPGGLPWNNRTLLRNRALDVWVHEQDVRRAAGRAGGMGSLGAALTEAVFVEALPYVVAKRAQAHPGARVALLRSGRRADLVVDEHGRAHWVEPAGEPSVTLDLDREALTVLGAGRRQPDDLPATAYAAVTGDTDLGDAILRGWAVTP